MRTCTTLLLAAVILTAGCTHTFVLRTERDYRNVTEEAAGSRVTVVLRDGRVESARGLRVRGDSTFWTVPRSRERMRAANTEIVEIRIVRGKVIEGMVVGFGGGAAIGAARGLIEGDDPSGILSFSAGDKMLVYSAIYGLVGGLSGAVLGSFVESPDTYRFAFAGDRNRDPER